jgi:DNA-binding NtrC family response regulator
MDEMVRVVRVAVAHRDPALRRSLLRALKSMGAEVLDATTAQRLRELLRSPGPFDLVVVDVWMAELSGASLVAELRVRGDNTAAILTADHLLPSTEASLVDLGHVSCARPSASRSLKVRW